MYTLISDTFNGIEKPIRRSLSTRRRSLRLYNVRLTAWKKYLRKKKKREETARRWRPNGWNDRNQSRRNYVSLKNVINI